jgi:hypothetical protein
METTAQRPVKDIGVTGHHSLVSGASRPAAPWWA